MADPSKYVRVKRVAVFVAKQTTKRYQKGKPVSQTYVKRYPNLVRKLEYMIYEQRELKYDKELKHQTYGKWIQVAKERLTHYEAILPISKLTDRRISTVFARHRIYHSIWQNARGVIRVTINGNFDGRRIKEIVHIGYLKRLWEEKHNGYKKFKQDLLHKILNSLRRRRLRLSNPKESRQRIKELQSKLQTETHNLTVVPDWMVEETQSKIKSLTRSIREQRRTHQLLGGTIRIEKLVS